MTQNGSKKSDTQDWEMPFMRCFHSLSHLHPFSGPFLTTKLNLVHSLCSKSKSGYRVLAQFRQWFWSPQVTSGEL